MIASTKITNTKIFAFIAVQKIIETVKKVGCFIIIIIIIIIVVVVAVVVVVVLLLIIIIIIIIINIIIIIINLFYLTYPLYMVLCSNIIFT